MSDEQTQPQCGHSTRYIVQADEGTAYCAMCEMEGLYEKADDLEAKAAYYRRQAIRLKMYIEGKDRAA